MAALKTNSNSTQISSHGDQTQGVYSTGENFSAFDQEMSPESGSRVICMAPRQFKSDGDNFSRKKNFFCQNQPHGFLQATDAPMGQLCLSMHEPEGQSAAISQQADTPMRPVQDPACVSDHQRVQEQGSESGFEFKSDLGVLRPINQNRLLILQTPNLNLN